MESYQQRAGREAIMTELSVDPRDEKLRADIEEWWDEHKAGQESWLGVEPFYELAKIIRGET
jgi:hypothetical protein